MLIKTCLECKYHEIKDEEKAQMSYCSRENCWSEYSKCVANKALNRFLQQETTGNHRPFSVLGNLYSAE